MGTALTVTAFAVIPPGRGWRSAPLADYHRARERQGHCRPCGPWTT